MEIGRQAIYDYLKNDLLSDTAEVRAKSYFTDLTMLKEFLDTVHGGVAKRVGYELDCEKTVYKYAKMVYDGQITADQAVESMVNEVPCFNNTSHKMTVMLFSSMMNGDKYTRRANTETTLYFITQMGADYGREHMVNALKATQENIKYYYEQSGNKSKSICRGCKKIAMENGIDITFDDSIFEGIIPKENKTDDVLTDKTGVRYWIYSPYDAWEQLYADKIITIGRDYLGDPMLYDSRSAMQSAMQDCGTEKYTTTYKNASLEVWQFIHDIKPGDVVFAKKGQSTIIGRGVVTSDFIYDETKPTDFKYYRQINWTHMENRIFACIDLKSFYASVECIERGLDPMTTNLLVADASRTEKTICLAVSPSLKSYGISGRARLFEAVQQVKVANAERIRKAPGRKFTGESYDAVELANHPELAISYITAPPRMAHYMECSTKIYNVYLKYIAPEDIHVYSIDEVFIDLTHYLSTAGLNAHDFARMMIKDVLKTTGITATAGIGTNMYLAKIAMDIMAKRIPADKDGVRIAELDEMSYRQQLWDHRPLTDFWRVGRGYAKKLEENGLFTMGDVARCSVGKPTDHYNEDLLYKLFGVNAELLIDHAWGWEPCTIAEVKQYKPTSNSVGSGQVLHCPYDFEKAKLIVREMIDLLVLDLVDKGLVTDQIVLTVGYDIENLTDPKRRKAYTGPVTTDHYGRQIPKHAHGTANISRQTSSTKLITDATMELYDRIVNPALLVRRLNISANHVVPEDSVSKEAPMEQLDLFTDYEALEKQREEENAALEREKKMQQTMLTIKKKFGKNAILKGMNLQEGATAKDRNQQIGGHKA